MKKILLLTMLLCSSFIFGACSEEANENELAAEQINQIINTASQVQADNVLTGEITISTFDSDMSLPFLEETARLFMHKHPYTIVNVEGFSTPIPLIELESGAVTSAPVDPAVRPAEQRDYINRINTELMSGRGPDILSMDVLPFHRYAASGQLLDLQQFMNNDANFNINDYRANILDAITTEQGLFMFPLDYIFNFVAFDSYLMQNTELSYAAYSFYQLFNIARPIWENRDEAMIGIEYTQFFMQNLNMNFGHFIDLKNRQANFTDGRFVDMLNRIQEYEDTGVLLPQWGTPGWDQSFNSRRFYTVMPALALLHELFEPEDRTIFGGGNTVDNVVFAVLSNEGGQTPFTLNNALAINANTNYPELAWEFIKFASSATESLQFFTPGLPANIRAFEARSRREVSGDMWNPDWVDTGLTDAQYDLLNRYLGLVEIFTSALDTYFWQDASLENLIWTEVTDNFFNGTQTAEDVAQALQSRINLFLNE